MAHGQRAHHVANRNDYLRKRGGAYRPATAEYKKIARREARRLHRLVIDEAVLEEIPTLQDERIDWKVFAKMVAGAVVEDFYTHFIQRQDWETYQEEEWCRKNGLDPYHDHYGPDF